MLCSSRWVACSSCWCAQERSRSLAVFTRLGHAATLNKSILYCIQNEVAAVIHIVHVYAKRCAAC